MNDLVEIIKQRLRKKAVTFQTGGIRPTYQMNESWIGKVCWKNPGEQQPLSKNGDPMIPLATIFVPESDYVPKALKDIKMINIFLDVEWEDMIEGECKDLFVINTYENLDNLVSCNYLNKEYIDAFPLIPNYVDNEFPLWPDFNDDIEELMESAGVDMDNYDDIIFEDNNVIHKLGGYPCFIQSPIINDNGYEFVLQIYSDEKAGFNIIDGGSFYFSYNPSNKDWSVQCDFY